MKQYAIFDMDGTLIDSMPYWRELGRNYLAGKGVFPTAEELSPIDTMTLQESAAYFISRFGISGTAEEVAAEMNACMDAYYRNEIPLKPGADTFLRAFQEAGVRMGIATGTDEGLAKMCLKRLGVLPLFEFIVSCETIGKSKAFPDIYTLAAKKFADVDGKPVSASEIAVFEDAGYCIRTAKDAGYYTVALYDPEEDREWAENRKTADAAFTDWDEALRLFHTGNF